MTETEKVAAILSERLCDMCLEMSMAEHMPGVEDFHEFWLCRLHSYFIRHNHNSKMQWLMWLRGNKTPVEMAMRKGRS